MKTLLSRVALALAAMLIYTNTTFAQDRERITGNGDVKKESRDVSDFSGLSIGGSGHVYLVQGDKESVEIEAESNLLPYIVTDRDDNNLSIHYKKGYDLKTTKPINIYITIKKIDYMGISGGVILDASKGIKTDELKLRASGSLKMDLQLDAKSLYAEISGSVAIKIKGSVDKATYSISGSGDVTAPGLNTSTAQINISGSARLDLDVAKNMEVNISGSGSVHYSGSPNIVKHVSGSGKIYNN